MVRREVTDNVKADRLEAWRFILKSNKERAHGKMQAALARMRDAGIFHHTEIARAASQMAAGVAVPEDFGTSEVFGVATIACN